MAGHRTPPTNWAAFALPRQAKPPVAPRKSWWLNVKPEDFSAVARAEAPRMQGDSRAVVPAPMVEQ